MSITTWLRNNLTEEYQSEIFLQLFEVFENLILWPLLVCIGIVVAWIIFSC